MTYLLKAFNFGTLKVMKTCPVIRFSGTFFPGIRFFGEILPGLGFALAAHPYLPLLGNPLPPPSYGQDQFPSEVDLGYLQTGISA